MAPLMDGGRCNRSTTARSTGRGLAPDPGSGWQPQPRSFEALIDPEGHYEFERYIVSYLSSGRDLLRLATHRASRSPAVIVAGPDYGPLPSPPAPGTILFRPFPGVRAEATDLGRYFSTPPLTDKQATKEALAALIGPTILHVATHGFYTRDPGTTRAPGSRGNLAPPPAASPPPAPRGIHVEIDGGLSSLSSPPSSSGARNAKLHMLHRSRYAHAYYWAAFIPAGDWRPLDNNTIRPQSRAP